MPEQIKTARPAAPYSLRAPSPPYIPVPTGLPLGQRDMSLLMPDTATAASDLTAEEVQIITGNKRQIAGDSSVKWIYESRRAAQRILDFLYLGPSSVVRDHDWLRAEGITLILVARDARFASARLLSVDRAVEALGGSLRAEYVDVDGTPGLIRAFPLAVRLINEHLLSVYNEQKATAQANGSGESRSGKVLVVCETGNERSAAVVAAYIMDVYRSDAVTTLQFIGLQRFCASLDEDAKRLLQSWEDILRAKRMVSDARRNNVLPPGTDATPGSGLAAIGPGAAVRNPKRGIEDTIMEDLPGDGAADETYNNFVLDRDRYLNRAAFVPFVDVRNVAAGPEATGN